MHVLQVILHLIQFYKESKKYPFEISQKTHLPEAPLIIIRVKFGGQLRQFVSKFPSQVTQEF